MSSPPRLSDLSNVLQELQMAGPSASTMGGRGREGEERSVGVTTPSDSTSFTQVSLPRDSITRDIVNDSPSTLTMRGESNVIVHSNLSNMPNLQAASSQRKYRLWYYPT